MTDFLSTLWAGTLPAILQLIGAVLGLVLIRLSAAMKTRWGIEIEATHRTALHSALMSGIRAALGKGLTAEEAIPAAITYATASVPDALQHLGPSAEVLTSLARAKLGEAIAAQ